MGKKCVHDRTYKSQCKLLAKYQNLKYYWPENKAYGATIANVLAFVERDDDYVKGEPWGWHVILIPKGQTFDSNHFDEYERQSLYKSELQYIVSITEQDENVTCLDRNEKVIDPYETFKEWFKETPYISFKDLPDVKETNCYHGYDSVDDSDDSDESDD